MPILPTVRDSRLITVRRGGTLTDDDHRLLAEWAVACAEHVLPLFECEAPHDRRPHDALDLARAWMRGDATMKQCHDAAFVANAAGKGLSDPARFAALSAGQAVAVAHVAAHDLGAAAYAIRAANAAADQGDEDAARVRERDWQREQLPATLVAFVLEDQAARNPICWLAFSD